MNQGDGGRYHLGVDLGTTFTAAATWVGGEVDVLELGDRATSMPSVVHLDADGGFRVGEAAERRTHTEPERVAREFKRRFGDPTPIVLGGAPCGADMLTAQLLGAVVDLATSRMGAPPASVALTHPAAWGPYKLDLLRQAARQAECGETHLVAEPVAAVMHYSTAERVDEGAVVAVFDFGGGTFDAAVVRKTSAGAEILGEPQGIEDIGGVDLDRAVLGLVLDQVGPAASPEVGDPLVQSALLRLRDECRDAKEGLSQVESVAVPVMLPSVQTTVDMSRDQLEALAAPLLGQTVEALRATVASAGIEPRELQAVLLAGGSSRIPLVARMIEDAFGRPVALDAHPKFVVAMGAARMAAQLSGDLATEPAPGPTGPGAGGAVAAGGAAASVFADPGDAPPIIGGVAPAQPGEASVFTPAGDGGAVTQPTPAIPPPGGDPADPGDGPPTEPIQTVGPGPAGPDAPRAFPWVILVVAVLLFAGIVGAIVWLSGGDDEPRGEEATGTPAGEGDPTDDTDEGSAPTPTGEEAEPSPSPEPTDEPTAEPTAVEAAPFDPVPGRTVEVGPEPDTPLPVGGFLYVPNAGADTVAQVDPATGDRRDIVVGPRPDTMLSAAGAIWVPVRDAGTVVRLDPDTLATTSTLVGERADTPVFAADHIWVPVRGTNEMVVLDPADGSVVQRLALGGRPLTPIVVGSELWFVTRDDDSLHVVDLGSFDPDQAISIETIAVGDDPDKPIESAGRIWVPIRNEARLDVVDPDARLVVASVDVGAIPDTPVAAGGRVWVPNSGSDTVTAIDTDTLETVEIVVGGGPRTGVATDDDVWVPVADTSVLVRLDADEPALVAEFITGSQPDTPLLDGGSIWVPNGGSASIFELVIAN